MRLCFLTRNQISTNYRYIEIISVQKKVVISSKISPEFDGVPITDTLPDSQLSDFIDL